MLAPTFSNQRFSYIFTQSVTEVERAEQKVTLELPVVLLHGWPLAIERNGTGAVVGVTRHLEGLLGMAEMRQAHRGHHLPVLAQRRVVNLHHLARIQWPGMQWPLDRSPG